MAVKAIVYDTNPIRYVYNKGESGGPPVADLPAWAAASSTYMIAPTATVPLPPADYIHEFMAQAIGEGTPTFDTPDGLLLPDYEGVYHETPTDTMPVYGSRVVTNHLHYSNDYSQSSWAKTNPVTLLAGQGPDGADAWNVENLAGNQGLTQVITAPFSGNGVASIVSAWMRTDDVGATVRLQAMAANSPNIAIDGVWRRYSWSSPSSTGTTPRYGFIAGSTTSLPQNVQVSQFQVEIRNGQSDLTNPAEYIETQAASVTKHFTNLNGNTVTDNVVTEAEGTPLQSGVDDPTLVNSLIWSRELTAANGWTGATTASYTANGLTGEPNTAMIIADSSTSTTDSWLDNSAVSMAQDDFTVRYFVKKDDNQTVMTQCSTNLQTGGTLQSSGISLNTATGDFVDHGVGVVASEVNDAGIWWEVIAQLKHIDTTRVQSLFRPAYSTDVNTPSASEPTLTKSIVVGNVEWYVGKTIADIRGKSAMVTEGTTGGTPTQIGQMPSLYAAPEATNLTPYSNDCLGAAWGSKDATITPTTGLDGSPTSASLIEITAPTAGNGVNQVGAHSYLAGTITFKLYIKGGVDTTWLRYRITGNTSINYDAFFNLATGETGFVDPAITFEAEADGRGGWILYHSRVVASGAATQDPKLAGVTADGASTGTVGQQYTIYNLESYQDKTIAEVKGSAPIVTEGVAVTNTGILLRYDLANHNVERGAYYIENYTFGIYPQNAGTINIQNYSKGTIAAKKGSGIGCEDDSNVVISAAPTLLPAIQHKLGSLYNLTDALRAVRSNLGTWSADSPFSGYKVDPPTFIDLAGGSLGGVTTRVCITSNLQLWDLPYDEGKAKIDELMME